MDAAPLNLLVCFSPRDQAGKDELLRALAPVAAVSPWSTDDVTPGGQRSAEFHAALDRADAAVLLLSSDLLAETCMQNAQWPALLAQHQRGLRLIPILYRSCPWDQVQELADLKPLPTDGRALHALDRPQREAALTIIARAIAALPRRIPSWPPAPAAVDRPGQPYNGCSYVHRPALEKRALRLLSLAGQPVVLWGARGYGKSWLLHHLVDRVQEQDGDDARATLICLRDLVARPADFYRGLAERVVDALDRHPDYPAGWRGWVEHAFRQPGLPLRRLKFLLANDLLPRCPRRLVLAFDGADALVGTDMQDAFYGMLRGWAEATSSSEFDKLRILLAVSTPPDQLIHGLRQSPFNLTQPLLIPGLDREQLGELARAYGFSPGTAELQRLHDRTRGDPHEVRGLLYRAALEGAGLHDALGR